MRARSRAWDYMCVRLCACADAHACFCRRCVRECLCVCVCVHVHVRLARTHVLSCACACAFACVRARVFVFVCVRACARFQLGAAPSLSPPVRAPAAGQRDGGGREPAGPAGRLQARRVFAREKSSIRARAACQCARAWARGSEGGENTQAVQSLRGAMKGLGNDKEKIPTLSCAWQRGRRKHAGGAEPAAPQRGPQPVRRPEMPAMFDH